jgi:hypothetical protein
MRRIRIIVLALGIFGGLNFTLIAQSLDGMTMNGATGLYTVPTGRIGWGQRTDLGIDGGVTYDFFNKNPIARAAFSLFKWVELTTAFDFQGQRKDPGDNFDYLIGMKLQFPTTTTALALGGNLQLIHDAAHPDQNDKIPLSPAGQVYLAFSFPSQFFGMTAETSLALGYTFREHMTSNIDYGMGFDLSLFPDLFQNCIHWITDFSNFSYSIDPLGVRADYRGSLNTGIRIDIGAIPLLNRFKIMMDITATDILDEGNRSFLIGAVFGAAIL